MKSSFIEKAVSCALVLALVTTLTSVAFAQGLPASGEEVPVASETATWCEECQKDTEHNELGECIDEGHVPPEPPEDDGKDDPEVTDEDDDGKETGGGENGEEKTDPVVETPAPSTDTSATTEEDTRSFPEAYDYTPNAPYVASHYTQDLTTEMRMTSIAEQSRQIGQKYDFYASIIIAEAVIAGNTDTGLFAQDPTTLATEYPGALKRNADTYEAAAKYIQDHGNKDSAYAAKIVETIETYDLSRYDQALPYEITGQIYDKNLKNENDDLMGGMRDLTMEDYANLEAIATSVLGLEYVWGGTSATGGFDCSGFVQYCYREALGISLPRTTYTQQYQGTEIPFDQLQLGDIVFFDDRGDVNHVGMYLGNGYYIHSTSPGGVQITAMEDFTPAFAKRVANFQEVSVAPAADVAESNDAAATGERFTVTVRENAF